MPREVYIGPGSVEARAVLGGAITIKGKQFRQETLDEGDHVAEITRIDATKDPKEMDLTFEKEIGVWGSDKKGNVFHCLYVVDEDTFELLRVVPEMKLPRPFRLFGVRGPKSLQEGIRFDQCVRAEPRSPDESAVTNKPSIADFAESDQGPPRTGGGETVSKDQRAEQVSEVLSSLGTGGYFTVWGIPYASIESMRSYWERALTKEGFPEALFTTSRYFARTRPNALLVVTTVQSPSIDSIRGKIGAEDSVEAMGGYFRVLNQSNATVEGVRKLKKMGITAVNGVEVEVPELPPQAQAVGPYFVSIDDKKNSAPAKSINWYSYGAISFGVIDDCVVAISAKCADLKK